MKDGDFRAEVVAEVNRRYYGYLIAMVGQSGRYRFEGPARAFTAKYGEPLTLAWPDATDFLYRDSRANAAALVHLEPDLDCSESKNLRIYYYPLRVGYDGNRYRYQDTLLAVYLDPFTGTRSAFTIRESPSGQIGLYPLAMRGIPSHSAETSLVTLLGVATTEDLEVPIGPRFLKVNVHVKVPRHTYVAASYRHPSEGAPQDSTSPLGAALALSPAGEEVLRSAFEEALRAYHGGAVFSSSRFRQAYALITSAADRMPPAIANQPRPSSVRAR